MPSLRRAKRNLKKLEKDSTGTLKLTHIGNRELKKRFVFTNPELIIKLKNEGRNIVAICGHYCNWEWMSLITLYTDIKCVTVYKPLNNKLFDKFINDLRSKHGFVLTPMSNIVREINNDRTKGIKAVYAFIADQTPAKIDINFWTKFLGQDTPVYLGPEKIAEKYDMTVVFFHNQKTIRGHYSVTMEVLFENTAGLPEHTVTQAHVQRLEELIREKPEFWMWSHRRWKHKKEQNNV
jgi:KDO2-lipid IV(A) lauroyltransferase